MAADGELIVVCGTMPWRGTTMLDQHVAREFTRYGTVLYVDRPTSFLTRKGEKAVGKGVPLTEAEQKLDKVRRFAEGAGVYRSEGDEPDPGAIVRVATLVAQAERPVLVAGGDVYWARAEIAMCAFAQHCRVPVFVNGMGRGTLPADHDLAFSRARSLALKQAA